MRRSVCRMLPYEHNTDYSFCPISFKFHIKVVDERRDRIDFWLRGQGQLRPLRVDSTLCFTIVFFMAASFTRHNELEDSDLVFCKPQNDIWTRIREDESAHGSGGFEYFTSLLREKKCDLIWSYDKTILPIENTLPMAKAPIPTENSKKKS